MQKEIWRLYQHLIVGFFIILVCCYAAVEYSGYRFDEAKRERLLCVDAELSASALLAGIPAPHLESRFDWQVVDQSLSVAQITSTLSQKEFTVLPNGDYQMSFGDSAKPSVVGVAPAASKMFHLESLLKVLLNAPWSHQEKEALLYSISCLDVTVTKPDNVGMSQELTLVHDNNNSYGFLWQDGTADDVHYIAVKQPGSISLTYIVVAIVAVAIISMLFLIWRELFHLDIKRETFERMTRQIARGSSEISKEIPDSSGTLKELAYSFDSMSTHIQRLLKVQREMINAISHELRTPIARLRFGLEVIKDEVDESVVNTVSALEGDVEELNTLVDEVLTYGKLEEGTLALNFQPIDIKELVDSIVENNGPLLKQLAVRVEVSEGNIVTADEHHLQRALQNLILNASKYAAEQIAIVFSVDEERWQLDIEDDGPGIPFADRDKVFIPFQRLDNSRTRASGGYGLGLAIVQRIAFWHGGAVLVDESELGGAKFSLIWSRNQRQEKLS